MSNSLLKKTIVVLIGLGALVLGATPSVAATSGRAHHVKQGDSAWGGYDIQQGGKTVTGSWINPTVNCSGRGVNSLWAGFDGAGNSTVEQIGIDLDCSSGTVRYNPWYEMYPRDSVYFNEDTRAGDAMTATVVHDSGSKYTMTLTDKTRNWSRTFHDSLSSARDATAEVIMERLSDNVDNFGTVTFTNCTLDGKAFGNYPTNKDVLVYNGRTQVTTGPLSGAQFSMKWSHA